MEIRNGRKKINNQTNKQRISKETKNGLRKIIRERIRKNRVNNKEWDH